MYTISTRHYSDYLAGKLVNKLENIWADIYCQTAESFRDEVKHKGYILEEATDVINEGVQKVLRLNVDGGSEASNKHISNIGNLIAVK